MMTSGPTENLTTGRNEHQEQHPGFSQPAGDDSFEMPQLSARYVPGGVDDYHMPELVSPIPQRVMAEVPQNMQDDLQRLEIEARFTEQRRKLHPNHRMGDSVPTQTHDVGSAVMNTPNFSPFPRPKGERLPPSFSEKEEILFGARNSVLGSDNVVLQLSWARDVLQWMAISEAAAKKDWEREGKGRERPATPKFLRELKKDAMNIVEYLVQQSHPEATFLKGKWKELGMFGEREDTQEAYSLYKKAADMNYGRAEYRLATLYETEKDMVKAMEHYRVGAEKLGDTAACYRLGMLYLWGQHGLPQDYRKGLQLINIAADRADEESPQGAYVFGMLVAREIPDMEVPESLLPYDVQVAKDYIEKAAWLGFPKAQLKMGQAYELSQLGCDFNPTFSLHYYGLAALHPDQPEASLGVSRWFLFGSTDGSFDKNEALAFKYARDAADGKLATGEFAMGYYHEVGIHVKKDVRTAQRWYNIAAEHGNKDAIARIEALKQSKLLTKQDHETTTLTRIKSQHGSQRGNRPARFTRPNVMATVAEDRRAAGQPSHFAVHSSSRSTAPYPDDDQLLCGSTAPYPEEDDTRGRRSTPSPHYKPGTRPSADGPSNAFGMRSASPRPHLPAGYRQQSPGPSQDLDYRGRQPVQQSPYRQPSPGQPSMYRRPSPGQSPSHRPTNGGLGPGGGNRLQKSNPTPQGSIPYPSPPASGPSGREYRTPSDSYAYGSSDNGFPPRVDSAQPGRQGYRGPRPRPGMLEGQAGRASAPPTQQQHSYNKPSPPIATPPPSSASTTNLGSTRPGAAGIAHPDGKTMGNGPATFEEMGIPQGKHDSDCVVM